MNAVSATSAAIVTVCLCRLAIAATGIVWLSAGETLSFAVALVALLLTAIPSRIIRDPLLRDASGTVTALLLAAHVVIGMQFQLYELSLVYDKAMHVIGSASVAALLMILARSVCRRESIELPLALFALLIFTGTLSAGTLWEIFEFAVDRTGFFFAQRGLQDTMIDLLADALGAILAIAVFAVASHWKIHTHS